MIGITPPRGLNCRVMNPRKRRTPTSQSAFSDVEAAQPSTSGLESAEVFHRQVARELLRAMRGKRSQVALARRLGYTGNPITDWERGARHPTAREFLRAASLCRLTVREAFLKLVPLEPPATVATSKSKSGHGATARQWLIHPWLTALRGTLSNTELAARLGVSRYSVSRWCSGDTEIRLHEFLHCVEALTGRLYDWVASLVPIAQVPSLLPRFTQANAARNVALEHPWTEAILRVLETQRYRERPAVAHATLAATLGVSEVQLQQALDGLTAAAVVSRHHEPGTGDVYYETLRELSVDTRVNPQAVRTLQQHWLSVALERAQRGEPDWLAYNVFSCSEADLVRVGDCLKRAFRESRSIIAASAPNERAGLVLMQFVKW